MGWLELQTQRASIGDYLDQVVREADQMRSMYEHFRYASDDDTAHTISKSHGGNLWRIKEDLNHQGRLIFCE